ncbi:hypothetical protein MELB17_15122 [Marinobacter sp. ELB17]|nr:hypothetical protein MELB17_15122 [Marinobacter sp. ELB17]
MLRQVPLVFADAAFYTLTQAQDHAGIGAVKVAQ